MAKKDSKSMETLLFEVKSLNRNNRSIDTAPLESEWTECKKAGSMVTSRRSKDLYRVLHSTRLLDGCLRRILELYECLGAEHALGPYLKCFGKNNSDKGLQQMSDSLVSRFQEKIVDERNRYLHACDAFPTTANANEITSQIQYCIQVVLTLT